MSKLSIAYSGKSSYIIFRSFQTCSIASTRQLLVAFMPVQCTTSKATLKSLGHLCAIRPVKSVMLRIRLSCCDRCVS